MYQSLKTTILGIPVFFGALWRRLRLQGLRVTLQWLRTVGWAWLTGRISLSFSQVTPQLYLGPQYGRYGKRTLQQAGITATINMRAEFDDADYDLPITDYSHLPTVDNTAPSMENLEKGVVFINKIIDEGGKVYVHCNSGVGRAPTMVAAYLISQGKTLQDAVAQISEVRPFVRILPPQLERLRQYEALLRERYAEPAATSM